MNTLSLSTSSVYQELEKDELLFLIIIAFTFLFFLLHFKKHTQHIYNTRSAKPITYVFHIKNLALSEKKKKQRSIAEVP